MRNTNNIHHTSLCAKFSFGNVEMEKIECISHDPVVSEKYPTIIRSTVPLESAALGVVLDAIDAAVEDELCLDRTIAPFQCAVLSLAPGKFYILKIFWFTLRFVYKLYIYHIS